MPWWLLWAVFVSTNVANAALTYDDIYLVEHFAELAKGGSWPAVKSLLTGSGGEFRLYGLSRVFQFGLWSMFGASAWPYVLVASALQVATGYGIYRLLQRFGDALAKVAALVWVFSPFASVSCFHYYSYLILPYQLAVLCGLLMPRSRIAAAVCGVALGLTGESHFVAVPLFLLAIGGWAAVAPIVAMFATAAVARLAWLPIASQHVGPSRFEMALPDLSVVLDRMSIFLRSLYAGMADQVMALAPYFDGRAVALAVPVVGISAWVILRSRPASCFPLILASGGMVVASLVVFAALAVASGLVAGSLQWRYGFVPYTLALIFISAVLAAWRGASAAFGGAVVGLWAVLNFSAIPTIRQEDQRVWSLVRDAMAGKKSPAVVFMSSWDQTKSSGTSLPGLRGWWFPENLQSPFSYYWWQAQYAVTVLGAKHVAEGAVSSEGGVKLQGNPGRGPSVTVPENDVVVVADLSKSPPARASGLSRVKVFADWREFDRLRAVANTK